MLRLAALLVAVLAAAAAHAAPPKVLRVPFIIAETQFDAVTVSDEYSGSVCEEIFEPPLTYDFLARPAKLKPLTLEAMPEVADNGMTYTLHVKPGIFFADDPAFGGRKRELVARDYEYTFKRLMDPKLKSPNLWLIEDRIAGVKDIVQGAAKTGHFDYGARVPGIEVLDRYTIRFRLVQPDYDFLYVLAMYNLGAQAREVVERYGDDIGAHPVGTGPFRLVEWRRASKIVLERNPNFREEYYEAEPPADDPVSQQLYREGKGKRLPIVDRVEIYILEESQPRWLAFLNEELDYINLPYEFLNMAVPGGKLAPALQKRGIRWIPDVELVTVYTYINMRDPVWGGYQPEQIALRRALSLAYDNQEDAELVRNGTAIEARTLIPPGVQGYEPGFNLGPTFDIPRAKALLDMFGYVDRDGDGWRDLPDGRPLVFRTATQPDQLSKMFTQIWKKGLDALGVRLEVEVAPWPDIRKKSKQGLELSWQLAWGADYPDGENFYQLLYGPNCGVSNDGCFQLPEYDRLFEQARRTPPGPERNALYARLARIVASYAPMKLHVHRKYNYMMQPWVKGWRRHPILHQGFKYLDIERAEKPGSDPNSPGK